MPPVWRLGDDTMPRELTAHRAPGSSLDPVTVAATDEPGSGGACHDYELSYDCPSGGGRRTCKLHFQDGPLTHAVGVNGITNEALLAVVIDRMRGFQSGPLSCRENSLALTKLEEAMHWLHHRTAGRVQRGVEGTLEK